ncbi:hypothetical protein BRC85_03605 [Halobacteriales archaeon QS_1_69_70]|nr:MAG: hypothetical protein BRC85_03605 [Halobacteriales archaeon QS_1_69_70]
MVASVRVDRRRWRRSGSRAAGPDDPGRWRLVATIRAAGGRARRSGPWRLVATIRAAGGR